MTGDSTGAAVPESDEPIGRALYGLRRRHGLSGHALADMAGLSQSKISRIETGVVLPSPDDVTSFLRGLGEAEDVISRYREWAARVSREESEAEAAGAFIGRSQPTYAEYEQRARTVRVFQPTVIPGLLQTSEYVRSLVQGICTVLDLDYHSEGANAVAERLYRQRILYDSRKRFTFTIRESVLAYKVASPASMIAQLDLLKDLSRRDNVEILILPTEAAPLMPGSSTVEIFDDRLALAETLIDVQPYTKPGDMDRLVRILDYIESEATSDIDSIIDRQRLRYLDELS